MKKQQRNVPNLYSYDKPGCFEMAYRIPDNLFGKTHKKARKVTDRINM